MISIRGRLSFEPFIYLLVFGALGATLFWWIWWGYLPNSQSSMIAPANLTSMASLGISHYKPMISIYCINAGNPKINLPFGDGSYNPFIMIWGIVYRWVYHIAINSKSQWYKPSNVQPWCFWYHNDTNHHNLLRDVPATCSNDRGISFSRPISGHAQPLPGT